MDVMRHRQAEREQVVLDLYALLREHNKRTAIEPAGHEDVVMSVVEWLDQRGILGVFRDDVAAGRVCIWNHGCPLGTQCDAQDL